MTRIYTNVLKDQDEDVGSPSRTPGDLAARIAVALVPLGLTKVISWDEAAYVLEALQQYDREEAARHNRRQEIIRMGGLPQLRSAPAPGTGVPASRIPSPLTGI